MNYTLFNPKGMEKWAGKHKYRLTFLSVMFIITWFVEFLKVVAFR